MSLPSGQFLQQPPQGALAAHQLKPKKGEVDVRKGKRKLTRAITLVEECSDTYNREVAILYRDHKNKHFKVAGAASVVLAVQSSGLLDNLPGLVTRARAQSEAMPKFIEWSKPFVEGEDTHGSPNDWQKLDMQTASTLICKNMSEFCGKYPFHSNRKNTAYPWWPAPYPIHHPRSFLSGPYARGWSREQKRLCLAVLGEKTSVMKHLYLVAKQRGFHNEAKAMKQMSDEQLEKLMEILFQTPFSFRTLPSHQLLAETPQPVPAHSDMGDAGPSHHDLDVPVHD